MMTGLILIHQMVRISLMFLPNESFSIYNAEAAIFQGAVFPNGAIFRTEDFFFPHSEPMRKVIRMEKDQSFSVGHPDFAVCSDIVEYNGRHFLFARMNNDDFDNLYEYDGANYNLVTQEELMFKEDNEYSNIEKRLFPYRDHLYAFDLSTRLTPQLMPTG